MDAINPVRMDDKGIIINPNYTYKELEEWGEKSDKLWSEHRKYFGISEDMKDYRFQDIFKCADVGVFQPGTTSKDVNKLKKTMQI